MLYSFVNYLSIVSGDVAVISRKIWIWIIQLWVFTFSDQLRKTILWCLVHARNLLFIKFIFYISLWRNIKSDIKTYYYLNKNSLHPYPLLCIRHSSLIKILFSLQAYSSILFHSKVYPTEWCVSSKLTVSSAKG